MPRRFFGRKFFIVSVVTIVAVCMIVFGNPAFFSPVRYGVAMVLAPFQKITFLFSEKILSGVRLLSSIGNLKEENERLERENAALRAEKAALQDVKNENKQLRDQIQLLPRETFSLIAAEVIAPDPLGQGNWMTINRGTRHGVTTGAPVIVSGRILMGRVHEVFAASARVMLTTHPESVVNATVSDTGAQGIVRGHYGLGLTFDMALQTDSIPVGSTVVTSHIGDALPQGLSLGIVQEVHPSEDRLFQQATLTPSNGGMRQRFVFVIATGEEKK